MRKRINRILAVVLATAMVFQCIDVTAGRKISTVEAADVSEESGNDTTDTQSENNIDTDSAKDTESLTNNGSNDLNSGQEGSHSSTLNGEQGDSVSSVAGSTETEEENGNEVSETEEIEEDDVEGDGIDLSSEDVVLRSYAAAADSENIPKNVADVIPGTIYYVRTYDDVLALQELSYQSSLEGCIFEFAKLNNITDAWDLTNIGFTGLGNETYPFQGTIQEFYASGTTFKMSRPMFNYLGTGAAITNFTFNLENTTSGIADYFVITDTREVTYTNVTVAGTVANASGAAGALYGTVSNEINTMYEIIAGNVGLDVTGVKSISGQIAGGYIGDVQGAVRIRVTDGSNVAGTVTSTATAAGGIIGRLGSGSELLITDVDISIGNTVTGTGSAGGIVGVCENGSITSVKKVTKTGTRTVGSVNAGGFVGLIVNSTTSIEHFVLSAAVAASNNAQSYAGGAIGQYQAQDDNASLTLSHMGVTAGVSIGAGINNSNANYSRSCGSGGIIGYINGSHVTISNIQWNGTDGYDFLPTMCYSYSGLAACGVGGIAGIASGKDIQISDVAVSFTTDRRIIGYYAGDVLGYVGAESKLKLTDITVSSNYTGYVSGNNTAEYNGGIAGFVDKGCVMALCGRIDLSGISYLNDRTGVHGNHRGYVAGGQMESIIYLEQDAELLKNATASDLTNQAWTVDYYGSAPGYTIDDIGAYQGYGSVYKNILGADGNPVIQWDNEYGQEVTGSVAYTDGKYEITGDADALRLALALNTFDASGSGYALRFAADCFQSAATAKSLLEADYLITADLDFTKTGIFSLCRNDSTNYVFTGTMTGKTGSGGTVPDIKFGVASRQSYGGLFPMVKDASFSNLKLSGYIYYVQNIGGIAAFAEGDIIFDNITCDLEMKTYSYIPSNTNIMYYYGGLLGKYYLGDSKLSVTNCNIAPDISNIRMYQMAGGIVGYLQTERIVAADTNVTVTDTTIGTHLTADSKFAKNYNNANTQARVGGMFACIGYDHTYAQNTASAMGGSVVDATYAKLKLTKINISDAVIDMSVVSDNKAYVRVTGGLLGYDWNNVEVEADQLTISNSEINSLGHTGGLLAALAGKLDLGNVKMDGLKMTNKSSSAQTFSGFLVGDGRYAVVTLQEASYIITPNTTAAGYSYFDEIVGVNLLLSNNSINTNSASLATTNGVNSYSGGGIVNILKSDFAKDMTSSDYESYQNQVLTSGSNHYTRYYYNLFTSDYETNKVTVSGNSATLDSPKKLMLWHLAKYMNSNIQRFIVPYFEGGAHTSVTTWTLSGNLDMNGYSYYPTCVNGGTYQGDGTAVVSLCGEALEEREADNKKPGDSTREHYLMHAALFWSPTNVTVEKLTFRGTATNLGANSGVLAAGAMKGANNISEITLNGIRLSNYTDAAYAGLLIGKIIDGSEVNLDTISTIGYHAGDMAAAALIGTVGSDNTRDIKIYFKNMKVADEAQELFYYASFIYHYDYVDNADINETFGLYTFTKQDSTNGNVTYGQELSRGVNYQDQDKDSALEQIISDAAAGIYNPYVFEKKDIFVNPRNGSITEGCGTYEDPYVINNRQQFLTLYCYLLTDTNTHTYDSIFYVPDGEGHSSWSVNPIGGGSDSGGRCNLTTGADSHTAVEYGKTGFPTRDELRTAYYIITEDIDLSDFEDLNEYVLNRDFCGLGTTDYPFAGVLAGKKADGSTPTITLPETRADRFQAYYGLIQYMKGAVVKDLILEGDNIRVSNAGGGVAAVALGGDNIIDNVTVKLTLVTNSEGSISGGYVGLVKRGSVIIRNMEKKNVENYSVALYTSNMTPPIPITKDNHLNYKKNCRVIGWVEDGCVLYEGANVNESQKTLEQKDFGFDIDGADGIPLSYSFPIVNENYLLANCSDTASDGRIMVTGDESTGFTLSLKNEAQLEIAALALNSDAFSIYNSGGKDTNHYNGYDYTAICRKADYSDLGCKYSGRDASADFALATGSDDNNGHYPYLYYRYMDFSGVNGYEATQKQSSDGSKRISMLNWSDGSSYFGNININDVTTTYRLLSGVTYDLSDFGRSFRGFGALYQKTRPYAYFRANFDGSGATIQANMERDWDNSLTTTGLFNNLTMGQFDNNQTPLYRQEAFEIGNFTILDSTFKNSNTISGNGTATGAVAGYVKGIWNFHDITLRRNIGTGTDVYDVAGTNSNANSYKSFAGGLVGAINYYSTSSTYAKSQQVQFNNCRIEGAAIQGSSSVGGLVGKVDGRTDNTSSYYGDISFLDCGVEDSRIETSNAHIGGFIGRVGEAYSYGNTNYAYSRGTLTIARSDGSTEPTVSNTTIKTTSGNTNCAGGLVGIFVSPWNNGSYEGGYAKNLAMEGVWIDNLTIVDKTPNNDWYGVGGMCGGVWSYESHIWNADVTNSTLGYDDDGNLVSTQRLSTGGLFGTTTNTYLNVKNTQVTGSKIASYERRTGGFFGTCNATNLTILTENGGENRVNDTTIESKKSSAGGLIGTTTLSTTATTTWDIAGVTVQNSHINNGIGDTTTYQSAGALIGRVNSITYLTLSQITVGSAAEIDGYHAGGLIGYAGGNTVISLKDSICVGCKSDGAGGVTQDADYTSILGRLSAGGLFGTNEVQYEEKSSADVQIQKTRIGAFYTYDNDYGTAGGIAGRKKLYSPNSANICVYDKVTILDCVIAANHNNTSDIKIQCGGLYGRVEQGNGTERKMCFYNPKLINNSIGYASGLTSMEELKKLTNASNNVYLLTGTGSSAHWSSLDINENNVGTYALRIGNYIGTWAASGKYLYILRPELTYADSFAGSRPAIDIGNQNTGTQNNDTAYGLGYPYAWRSNCHIVYFEPDAAATTDAVKLDSSLLVNGENEYLYQSLDTIVADYNSNASKEDYLEDYNLNIMLDESSGILDYYNKCCRNQTLNGVPVVYADGGSAQDILDSVVAILTNGGGIAENPAASAMTGLLNVSVARAKITTDGRIVADTRTKQSIVANNNKLSYQNLTYDDYNESDNSYTISLLYFRYGWEGADGDYRYETIYVPVFVVERIAFYSDLHIMEGEQYSLDKAKDDTVSYSGSVTVAHDSTYTLYAELAYGAGRNKTEYQNFEVQKTLTFQKVSGRDDATGEYTWEDAKIPEGMKFSLVDAETGKVYYYTEETADAVDIDFTKFKDEQGNSFVSRKVSQMTPVTDYQYGDMDLSGYDFGLERFFIYADPSEVKKIDNAIFKISITTEETEPRIMNFLDRTEYEGIHVTWMPGVDISFEGKEEKGVTFVTGNIGEEDQIQIDARIQISANQTYWEEKKAADNRFIDSENNNKYLDIAIYLVDKNTGEYVKLPDGTNILMDGGATNVAVGQYVTYAYKDWGYEFPISSIGENLTGEQTIVTNTATGETVNNYVHLTLDFSLADVDDYVGNSYDVYMELRRTPDSQYPLGDKRVDEYSEPVEGIGYKDMAVALSVEDLMDLGINTYQETTTSYEIPFTTKIDFSGMIIGDNPSDITTCADSNYLVTYRLKKKVKKAGGGYEYVTVGDSSDSSSLSGLHLGKELKLATAKKDSSGNTVYTDLPTTSYGGDTVYQMVKKYSESDIKKGTDGIKYLLTWELALLVDTEGIADEDLSNYMVEVTVLPYSTADIPDSDEYANLIDYYIFTIGKLKTDM